MYYRLKFILKDLFVEPFVMFWKQILISCTLAGLMMFVKADIFLYFTTVGLAFLFCLMVTIANDNYNRTKQKMLESLGIKKK